MIWILLSLLCIPNPPLVQVLCADVEVLDWPNTCKVTLLYVNSDHGTDGKPFLEDGKIVHKEFLTIIAPNSVEEFHFDSKVWNTRKAIEALEQWRGGCLDKKAIDMFKDVVIQHGSKLPPEKQGVWLKVASEK